jgi:PAS domain S-box-containing protein
VSNIFNGVCLAGALISPGYFDLWQPGSQWFEIVANVLTAIAYYSMPILLLYHIRNRSATQFDKLIFRFNFLTIASGTSNLLEIWTIWQPIDWLSGLLKAAIAIVSVSTVIELRSALPQLLQLPSLRVTNENLEREITERQRMELALRDSEQLQRAIVESVNYSIISTTLEGEIRSVNTAAQRWLGYTAAEVVGKTPLIIHDLQEITDRSTALSQKLGLTIEPGFQRFIALSLHGEFTEQEWTYIRKDGSRFPVLLSITSLRDANDNVTGFVAIGNDITERKQAEAALRQSKDELEARVIERTIELSQLNQQLAVELRERQRTQAALEVSQVQLKDALRSLNFHFENSPLGVVEWNRDFQVIRWSGAAEKIFGWSAGEVLGKHISEWQFVYLEDVERIRLEVTGLIDGTIQRSICHNRNYRKDGAIVNCEWYNSALLDEDGQMKSVLSMGLDVTDRDRVERMKDEFISVVSHELRTPLTSIYGALGMLASGSIDPQSDKAKRLVNIAVNSTERLIRMINDILDIERIESGQVRMLKERCTVTDLLTTAVNTVQPLAEQAEVSIVISTIPEFICADADRIVRALTNLLSNSIKFSAPGQTIDCKVEREPGYLLFQVRDRGRGIPADKLESIFERFQQVDSSDSRNHEGTGLGLAISRTIVQQHSGQIWVESVVGEGSTFFFRLPALDASPLIVSN